MKFQFYLADLRGAALPLVALVMPVIIGVAGLGVDVSLWMYNKHNLQTAVDAAVLAAAWEIAYGYDQNAEEVALREAERNGYTVAEGNTINLSVETDHLGARIVTGLLSESAKKYLSQVIFSGAVTTNAAAASAVIDADSEFCILSLDKTASGAITVAGTAEVTSVGCGIAVNSNSSQALTMTGSANVDIKDLNIVGDYSAGSRTSLLTYGNLKTHSSPVEDPYADLTVPWFDECSRGQVNNGPVEVEHSTTLEPGVYCGGLSISGNAHIVFEPGVYYIDGGNFTVTGGGSLTGEGVSFIMTNSGGGSWGFLDISGSKEIYFSGPAEGEEMEGVVFYGDRNAPVSSTCNSLKGTSAIVLQGSAYFPTGCFELGGDNEALSAQVDPCTRLIARTVVLSGNPSLGNSCENTAVKDIRKPGVRLVL